MILYKEVDKSTRAVIWNCLTVHFLGYVRQSGEYGMLVY